MKGNGTPISARRFLRWPVVDRHNRPVRGARPVALTGIGAWIVIARRNREEDHR
jgi:hypothetical protein